MSITIYPKPNETSAAFESLAFDVFVREHGKDWRELFTYFARNMIKTGRDPMVLDSMTFVYFDTDFAENVDVRVVFKDKDVEGIESVKIRPLSRGIEFVQRDSRTVEFSIDKPMNISVEINGNIYENLMIFAGKAEEAVTSATYYFPPGVHDAGAITLHSGESVYIAGGAWVYGTIISSDAADISVRGRGVLCGTMTPQVYMRCGANMINFNRCTDCAIEGIIIVDSSGWGIVPIDCRDLRISGVKMMNCRISSDGIDPCGCENLMMDNLFLRVPDDCISIKALGKNPNKNITVRDSILWADCAHAVLIGPEGNGTYTEDVLFENIDILEVNCHWPNFWGALAITNGDDMTIQRVAFKDIRIEPFSVHPMSTTMFNIRIEDNFFTSSPGGPVKDVLFKDIDFCGDNSKANVLQGYSAERNVSGVVFENVRVNSEVVTDIGALNVEAGEFVEDVIVKK